MSELRQRILDEVAERGPLRFSEFVDRALYEPGLGFYASAGRAGGRSGDFVTSVEAGPLFGAVIADWLDQRWVGAGRPDKYSVIEAGAGVGTLWRAIVRAEPACLHAVDWTLVERSASQRMAHAELPRSPQSAPDLPDTAADLIIANELLDNLAFDIAVRDDDGWSQLFVAASGESQLTLSRGAWPDDEPIPDLPSSAQLQVGTEIPWPIGARRWLDRARSLSEHVLVFDYTATTDQLAKRGRAGWLRAYAGHQRVENPLAAPGNSDITHDVAVDALPTPSKRTVQADWLRDNGLEQRLRAARQTWQERAHIGDLAALFARSAINEAAALTDPSGLGAFEVLEWW